MEYRVGWVRLDFFPSVNGFGFVCLLCVVGGTFEENMFVRTKVLS